ncbi:MAG: sn-glycerol-3-phosphate ABC transporter ATP-binding protein UgpC [Bradyrhizobium sp.]|nr:MAG: sn-glycerol-3-phosphate ABC transporter ATP-binding protein UgpC [Bradyrhizobium sp.]
MARVALKNVSKSFGTTEVIHDVSLSLDDGEFAVFVGPSGCGKSTLLRMIAGLEEVSSGAIEIAGVDVTRERAADRGIAMVFQSYALYPHMTVAKNMSFGLRVARRPRAEIQEKLTRAAKILRLEDLLERKPSQLSGGQRQRVAIGRAIVRDPKVFLFDEPLSNLDAELRVQMRVEIGQLHQVLGSTMIYVTHDQVEAMTMADRIVVLRAGRVEQVGKPLDLYGDPVNAFVAGFIGSPRMNFLSGVVADSGRIKLRGLEITPSISALLAPGRKIQVGIRPEHFDAADGYELGATVDMVEALGATSFVYATAESGDRIVAERRGPLPKIGDAVKLRFEPSAIRLFSESGERLR